MNQSRFEPLPGLDCCMFQRTESCALLVSSQKAMQTRKSTWSGIVHRQLHTGFSKACFTRVFERPFAEYFDVTFFLLEATAWKDWRYWRFISTRPLMYPEASSSVLSEWSEDSEPSSEDCIDASLLPLLSFTIYSRLFHMHAAEEWSQFPALTSVSQP